MQGLMLLSFRLHSLGNRGGIPTSCSNETLSTRSHLLSPGLLVMRSGIKQSKANTFCPIATGDFNCILGASAASSYLAFGSVEPGVPEWGRPCPPEVARVPTHGYTTAAAGGMQSAHECSSAANVTGTWSFGEEFTCVTLSL